MKHIAAIFISLLSFTTNAATPEPLVFETCDVFVAPAGAIIGDQYVEARLAEPGLSELKAKGYKVREISTLSEMLPIIRGSGSVTLLDINITWSPTSFLGVGRVENEVRLLALADAEPRDSNYLNMRVTELAKGTAWSLRKMSLSEPIAQLPNCQEAF